MSNYHTMGSDYIMLPGARLEIGPHGKPYETLGQSSNYIITPGARLEVGKRGLYETLGSFGGSGTLFLIAGALLAVAVFAGKRGSLFPNPKRRRPTKRATKMRLAGRAKARKRGRLAEYEADARKLERRAEKIRERIEERSRRTTPITRSEAARIGARKRRVRKKRRSR